MTVYKSKPTAEEQDKCKLSRRKFLMYSGTAAAGSRVVTLNNSQGIVMAREMRA